MSETNVLKKARMGERTVINNDFGGSSGKSDLTLIVGDQKIPVIKILLSMASPVFQAMFESDFSEKEKTEIELPEDNYKSFVAFLNCVYPDKDETVSEQNCNLILPVAHKYQVKKLLLSCEKILLDLITRQSHTYDSEFPSSKFSRNVFQTILETRKSYTNDSEFPSSKFSRNVFQTIQQAEKYQLKTLETKCLYLASELPSSEMSCGLFPISNESQTKIYRLALRRYELIRQDWATLMSPVEGSQKGLMHAKELKEVVVNTLKSKLRYRNSIYRAARLAYYHLPKDENLKCEIISALKSRDNYDEEFHLLPVDLKKELLLNK